MSDDKNEEPTTREPSVFRELAAAEIKLSTLLLDGPDFARRFAQILRAPIGFFRGFTGFDRSEFKASITFMLQSIALSFVIFTVGWALPRSIANVVATNVTVIAGSQADLVSYVQRVQAINRSLPSELATAWRGQGELMLLTRVLPEDRFNALLQRLGELSQQDPELLKLAIDGSLTSGERFGGRGYILTFFFAIDPARGPLLHQTYQLASAGPHYELPPHVEFLLRTVLLWYIACLMTARLLRTSTTITSGKTVFVIGAYLIGFLNPLFQTFDALVHCYLAATLPAYIAKASSLIMSSTGGLELGAIGGGVFPYENLILAVVRTAASVLLVAIAATAFAAGIGSAYQVRKPKAWATGIAGLAIGLGLTEAATALVVLILAPTGLL